MRILIANHWLKKLGGSETFTYTLIGEMVRQGHQVNYYTSQKGVVSRAIEKDFKVPFADSGAFDLILCSHNTMVQYCRSKMTGPIIQTCHGTIPKLEQPCHLSDAFVAISEEVKQHLLKSGISNHVELIHNGIDTQRFKPTSIALQWPQSVLSLSHSEQLNNYLKNYFSSRYVHFEALNKYKNPKWSIEEVINMSDLVISCGRGAMEALSCGRPAIVMDHRPYMPAYAEGLITTENINELLKCNFSGRRYMNDPYDRSILDEALCEINSESSDHARSMALEYFDIQKQTQKYLDYYARIN